MPKKIKLKQKDIELIVTNIINEQVIDEPEVQTDMSGQPDVGEENIAVAYMQPETKKVILINPKTKQIYLTTTM